MSISIIIKILIINQYFQVYERAFVIYIAFDQYYMPPTNEAIGQRTKVQKLDKASTVIKKKQPPQQRRRLLEQSFAKMNAELAQKAQASAQAHRHCWDWWWRQLTKNRNQIIFSWIF
jgi:hypothetical protein